MLCGGGVRAGKRRFQEHNATSFPAEVKTTAVSEGQAASANGWTTRLGLELAQTARGENLRPARSSHRFSPRCFLPPTVESAGQTLGWHHSDGANSTISVVARRVRQASRRRLNLRVAKVRRAKRHTSETGVARNFRDVNTAAGCAAEQRW